MKRSKLRNDFLKGRSDASQSAYRKQLSLCVTLKGGATRGTGGL